MFPSTPLQRSSAAWAVLAVAIFLGFGWTLHAAFLSDDFGYIQKFWLMELRSWPRLFVHELSEGMWGFPLRELRPVSALTFVVDARVWGGRAGGYHLVNLFVHLLCSGLVMLIARDVLARGWLPALVAGLLFALHPAHTEPVIWITGRADMLGTLGFLAAFYALVRLRAGASRAWLAAAWFAYAAGIFAKEFCLVLPLLAIAHDLVLADRSAPRRSSTEIFAPYLGWAVIGLVYYLCRVAAFGNELIVPRSAGAPAPYAVPLTQREAIYLAHMFWPLAPWLPTADADRAAAKRLLPFVLAIVSSSIAAWWWHDRRRDAREARAALFFAEIWFVAATLPFVVTYVSPRHLYLASAGVCIGLTAALVRFAPRFPVFAALAAAAVIACGVQLRADTASWRAASRLSREIGLATARVASTASEGELVLLDVPATEGGDCVNCVSCGAWVWAWASPFALRPPFQDRDVSRDLIVLERPEAYFHPEAWATHPSLARLRGYKGRAWLISTAAGHVTTIEAPADRVVPALERSEISTGATASFARLVTALKGS